MLYIILCSYNYLLFSLNAYGHLGFLKTTSTPKVTHLLHTISGYYLHSSSIMYIMLLIKTVSFFAECALQKFFFLYDMVLTE